MNSEAMAQAILRCIHNPDLTASMGQAGRKRVEAYYSRTEMLKAFHNIYEHLEEESHGRNRV
jgi:glycosyltransferase involved in cell wall biosynthesis